MLAAPARSTQQSGRGRNCRRGCSFFVRAAAAELGLGVSISAVPLCGSDGVAGPVSRTSIGRRAPAGALAS
jgi:hypothetical protein